MLYPHAYVQVLQKGHPDPGLYNLCHLGSDWQEYVV